MADGGMEGLVVDVKPTVFALRAAMSVYLYPQSRFYKDETLRRAMEQAIDFVARNQNEDGSFDYTVCNFHSAPDTAFCYHPMDKTYRLMKKFEYDVDTSSHYRKLSCYYEKRQQQPFVTAVSTHQIIAGQFAQHLCRRQIFCRR